MAGIPRNFEVYDPLDFLAEVTQHIPNKGEHQIRYYGWYSNKKRGMREDKKSAAVDGQAEPDTPFRRKCRIT
ncbi:MAG: transposase [Chitinispirillaceae bacterium]|nr:transposase [Chitinispirillaceae bacterium]